MPANSSALPCPHCGATASTVVDSRPSEKAIHRRRRCDTCGERFSTWEIIGDYSPLHASQRLTAIAATLRTTAAHIDTEVATLLRLRT